VVPALMSPASAKTVSASDGTDDPASLDVTSVTYRNGPTRAGVTIHVRDLQQVGTAVLRVGPVDSDVDYAVRVRMRADGTLAKTLTYETDGGNHSRRCAIAATWSSADDYVQFGLSHTCLNFGSFLSRAVFFAAMDTSDGDDQAPARTVGRGDSPGCATAGEISNVHHGHTRYRVATILDTGGRFGDGGAGGYSRVYRNCGGGLGWYVEYDGWTNRVVGKGRVRG
jgi:hypothetical protein